MNGNLSATGAISAGVGGFRTAYDVDASAGTGKFFNLSVSGNVTATGTVAATSATLPGVFDNTAGGTILSARVNGVEKLSVDGGGVITFSDGTKQTTSAGAASSIHTSVATVTVNGGATGQWNFSCPAGVGPGHVLAATVSTGVDIICSEPSFNGVSGCSGALADGTYGAPNGWDVVATNNAPFQRGFQITLICAAD